MFAHGTSAVSLLERLAKMRSEKGSPLGYGRKLFVPSGREMERLVALQSAYDSATISALDRIGVRPGWRCLEIGAGIGSIARNLAERVPEGHVVATDIETGRLCSSERSNLKVLRHDVTVDEFPRASFDLIHARFVLAHLPSRESTLTRMVGWLKPGGVLLIEGFRWNDVAGPDSSFTAAMAAYDALSAMTIGTDSSWPNRIPEALAANGLQRIETCVHDRTRAVRGGTPTANLWRLTLAQAQRLAVDSGLATDTQFTQALQALDTPGFVGAGPVMASSWGFRPCD